MENEHFPYTDFFESSISSKLFLRHISDGDPGEMERGRGDVSAIFRLQSLVTAGSYREVLFCPEGGAAVPVMSEGSSSEEQERIS